MMDLAKQANELADGWIEAVRRGALTYEEASVQSVAGMSLDSPVAGIILSRLRLANLEDKMALDS